MNSNLLPPTVSDRYQPELEEQEEELVAVDHSSRSVIVAGLILLMLIVGYAMVPKSQGKSLMMAPLVGLNAPATPAKTVQAPVAPSKQMTVTGRVINEVGKPIIGATVLLRGTSKGTSTDGSGNYSLEVPAGENTLLFGYGGYLDEEVIIRGTRPQKITLTPAFQNDRRRKK